MRYSWSAVDGSGAGVNVRGPVARCGGQMNVSGGISIFARDIVTPVAFWSLHLSFSKNSQYSLMLRGMHVDCPRPSSVVNSRKLRSLKPFFSNVEQLLVIRRALEGGAMALQI